jgi:hypothetical protein
MGITLYERWRMHVEQFCMYAEMDFRDRDGKLKRIGFSQRRMERAKICLRPTWEIYKNLLREAGVLHVVERESTDYTTRYIDDRGSLRIALNLGKVVLSPHPADAEPPFLPEPRFTVAQFPQHRFIRTAAHRPNLRPVTEPEPVQVPEDTALSEYTELDGAGHREFYVLRPRTDDPIIIGG